MIIREISTQSVDENGKPNYADRDSERYTPEEWEQMLKYLKRNKEAGLLKYKVIKE